MKNFVEELRWRGMIQDIMPGTEEKLMEGPTAAYVGIDPTADSLHIGHMVGIMILKHFQNCGHKPIALVGGATGMIGDPSMKSQERNLLDEETLNHNVAGIKKQLSIFLDFESDIENKAELVNNYDWMKGYSFLNFARDIGKHITVNYMMAKDSVKKRLSSESREGMSFTEFTYQLLQGYDFLYLYEHKGCTLQMGGSDQWGNITTGTELIRRKLGGEAYALTCPLITKADGGKFGKTESGNIWLDPERTSPYQFYQFWLQKLLAKEVTTMVHGAQEYENAVAASQMLFGNATKDALMGLDEKTFLAVFDGVPTFEVPAEKFPLGIIDLLAAESQVFPSKGECRKMIQANGVSINKEKVADINAQIGSESFINGKYILAQKGKKNYFIIKIA